VLSALHSFRPGSSAGPDGFRPRHIEDMFQVSGTALLDFINMVLSGGVPKVVRHVFFRANIYALRQKDGGLRPIAVPTLHQGSWV